VQTREELKSNINDNCFNINKKKLMISEFLENKKNNGKKKKLILVQNTGIFLIQSLPTILNFLKILRFDSETFYNILLYATHEQIKQISSFIINNFYYDIFSDKPSDELLCLIYRFLKNEINNIKESESFLENSSCRFLFEGLFNNPEIKFFFNNLLKTIVDEIEIKNSFEKWNLNISDLKLNLETNQIIIINNGIFNRNSNNNEFDKYINDISKKDLEDLLNKTEDEFIKAYISKQINLYDTDEKIYSNSKLKEEIQNQKMKDEIFLSYQHIFLSIIKLIDYIIKELNEKMNLIPHLLKYICKMIEIIIGKKFQNDIYQKNLFISKFFFNFLLCQFLNCLDYESLCVVSNQTQENFIQVSNIIKKLFSFEFFNSKLNSSFIPFNNFFLNESLPHLSQFFKEITKITFSPFMEKVLENENIFYYDFFKENPKELINQIHYCFNLYELNCLLDIVKSNLKSINEKGYKEEFKDEETNEKIQKLRNLLNLTIRRIDNYNNEIRDLIKYGEENNKIFYFLITNLNFNNDLSKYEKIKQSTCFTKPELENVITDEELLTNNLIKIDNFLIKLLFSYGSLNERDFSEIESKNLIEILNELIKILKTGRISFNSSVPPEWYGKSLVNLLNSLPEKYKKNNYDEILSLLKNDIQKSIDSLNPKIYSGIYEKLKYPSQMIMILTYIEEQLLDIELNKKIQFFCMKQELNIPLTLKKNANRKKMSFKFKTINNLLENFPIMSMKDKNGENNCLKNQNNDSIPLFFDDCFKIIFDKLKVILNEYTFSEDYTNYLSKKNELLHKNKKVCLEFDGIYLYLIEIIKLYYSFFNYENYEIINLQDLFNQFNINLHNLLNDKIQNYIMNILYTKLFPIEPLPKDIILYNKCVELSWIEPKHLINNEKIINNNFFLDGILLIQRLDIEKSPNSKINIIKKVFQIIKNIIIFSLEDIYLGNNNNLPIFSYILIKAKIKRLWSNFRYIHIYLGNKIEEEIYFKLQFAINMIENMKETTLYKVSKEEYEENCKKSLLI
jgi:hypothetical protein